MNKNPLITIVPQIFPGSDNILTRPGYMTEVLAAGGLPVLLPPTEEMEQLSERILKDLPAVQAALEKVL